MKYTQIEIEAADPSGYNITTRNAEGIASQVLFFDTEEDLRAWLDEVLSAPLEE